MVHYDRELERAEWLRAVCAGLEEEGVPYRAQPSGEVSFGAAELATSAAEMSPLQTGIGLDCHGALALQHEKLKGRAPYLQDCWQNGRLLGKNAGRLVKGLPLYLA